jgi:hypothetical protein
VSRTNLDVSGSYNFGGNHHSVSGGENKRYGAVKQVSTDDFKAKAIKKSLV